ncbi:tyrosine--tRNA ligase [Candidatus Pacearchaeota archaeon CG1_02_32_132]|nr:MAG: tyrosine--tRNA ligase [Candidatus Pacearchaeota archaeon CG1_02_32_132]
MNDKERYELITRNLEEVIEGKELEELIKNKEKLKHYIGFEISGKIHLGTGLMSMLKVKDLIEAGVDCSVFLADWHSWINDKLGGDREIIKKIAVGYFKEGMIASMKCLGGNPSKLKFILGSDLYHKNDDYWATMVDVSKNTTLGRMQRSITIMGRQEGESVDFAKLLYPPMQVADIFFQELNIAHSGLDQRKAHVIAREVANKMRISPLLNKKKEKIKPIALHHHLILGLGKPPMWPVDRERIQEVWSALKMSKSKPNTAIFIHDSPEEIKNKIMGAFCPEKEIEFNPVIDWCRYLIFRTEKSKLEVKRPEKFGGDKTYKSFKMLESDFSSGKLHPSDLKSAVSEELIKLLEPARKHFAQPKQKKMIQEMEKLLIAR